MSGHDQYLLEHPHEPLDAEARTVLKVYAHVLGEGQRRDFVNRLANAEKKNPARSSEHLRDTVPKDDGQARKSVDRRRPGISL